MDVIYQDLAVNLIFITTAILVLIITYFNHAYKYWANRGVPYLDPKFPYGNNFGPVPSSSAIGTQSKNYYDEIKKRGYKFGGVYSITRPLLILTDPEYIKDVMVRDFDYFTDRGHYHNEKGDPISAHLFSIGGAKWKNLRVKLTPTFTSGKMKMMFDSILKCAGYMKESLDNHLNEDVEIKEYFAKFTTDVIGSCAFGINCNSFKNPDADFRRYGKKIFEPYFLKSVRMFFVVNTPKLALKLNIASTNKIVADFFYNIAKETVEYREENNVSRPDFLQLLINMRKDDKSILTMDEIAAQVFLFFVAGFDTSSTTMGFAAYEIANNPDVQNKLREEINTVLAKHDNKLTYEALSELKYMQQVIDETLRMYPPLPTLNRDCVKDYKLRDTDITIEKGTTVIVSSLGVHYDPEYYPKPDVFDPERFSPENKATRHPFSHIPFGEGPRNCIGLRFGIMQSKIGLTTLVKNYKLTVSPKTVLPIELDPKPFLLRSTNSVYVNLEKIAG